MIRGVLVALLCYAVFSGGDAFIKGLGGRLSVFEIGFFVTLFALIALPAARPSHERWRDILRMKRPYLVMVRATSAVLAGILGVFAFTTLPMAEAYSLFFLAPLFVTMMSIVFLGERIGWRRTLAIVVGFGGVLLVVRPGFRELMPGHLAGVGVAICGATTVTALRALGPTERRITLMGMVIAAALAVNGVLMIPDFRVPTFGDFVWLAAAGCLSGIGQILLMAALRAAPANRVAPAQYSQIIWAMLYGAVFFGEFPDATALGGIVLVTFAGLFTFMREEQKGGRWPAVWTIVWGRPKSGVSP